MKRIVFFLISISAFVLLYFYCFNQLQRGSSSLTKYKYASGNEKNGTEETNIKNTISIANQTTTPAPSEGTVTSSYGISENNTTIISSSLAAIKDAQIRNYISGKALLLNVHVTHHAGTTFCSKIGNLGPRPSFVCMSGDNWPEDIPQYRFGKEWSFNETAIMVEKLRPYFHMISWEFGSNKTGRPSNSLHDTNWEYPNLVSVIIMRHPLGRLMSYNTCDKKFNMADHNHIPADIWWNYASSSCADNFALRILSKNPKSCCQGAETPVATLNGAKELLRRFTFILDMACLDESLVELSRMLNLTLPPIKYSLKQKRKHRNHTITPIRERIGNDTLYDYLSSRFRRDIELYEWSKSQSLVKCVPNI